MAVDPIPGAEASLVLLIPLFNDWASFLELVPRLDAVLEASGERAAILVVDDASTDEPPGDRAALGRLRAIRRIEVLPLRRNLGHQRAIAMGLAYLEANVPCEAVVVMDGDGEDAPEDVPRLVDRLRAEGGRVVVFAERTRRSESLRFRVFYAIYKLLHLLLVGHRVRVGNFSAIPYRRLSSLVATSELWNHYAASVFHSRQPYATIPTRRARRLRGGSSMNFVALVVHGLSAISVYGDLVGVRLLVVALAMFLLVALGLVATVAVRLLTDLAIPGWATTTAGLLLVLLLLSVMLASGFSVIILAGRNGSTFLPVRDYVYFIGPTWRLDAPGPPRGPE